MPKSARFNTGHAGASHKHVSMIAPRRPASWTVLSSRVTYVSSSMEMAKKRKKTLLVNSPNRNNPEKR